MAFPQAISVRRKAPVLLAPAEATPRELKLLSDIDDQDGFRFQCYGMQLYRPRRDPGGRSVDPVSVIREAISKILVHYYPLAGRLRELNNRKLAVDCTGEGLLFVEADADIRLDQFGDRLRPPIPFWQELIHDVEGTSEITNCPLMLIQITRLACGGFTFGLRFNHTVCDGLGTAQFLAAIADMARGMARPSVMPVWSRELLDARNPPRVTRVHREYEEMRVLAHQKQMSLLDQDDLTYSSFFFGPKEVLALRQLLPKHLRASSFQIISAHLWRCRTLALGPLHPNEEVRFICVVDSRQLLSPPLPAGYYGNAVAFSTAVTTAGELLGNPLGYAVELVSSCKSGVTNEYMRSVADYLVSRGRPHFITGRNCYMVTDQTRAGFGLVDYGWGAAVYGGPTMGTPMASFSAPFRNTAGVDGRVVTVCLPRLAMERFEQDMMKVSSGRSQSGDRIGDVVSETASMVTLTSNL